MSKTRMLTAEHQTSLDSLPIAPASARIAPGPIVRRTVDPAIQRAASEAAESGLSFGARGTPAQAFGTFCQRLDALVESADLRGQIRADALSFGREWLALTGNTEIRLSMCTIRDAHCPKVHVDHLDLRILCTYSGPGTLVEQDGVLYAADAGDIVYLPGTRWDGHGVRHRSPPLDDEARLVLRVDGLI